MENVWIIENLADARKCKLQPPQQADPVETGHIVAVSTADALTASGEKASASRRSIVV